MSEGVYLTPFTKDYLKLTYRRLYLDKTKLKGPSKHFLKCCSNLELKIGRDLKGSKIFLCRNIDSKIKTKENVGLKLSGTETILTTDMKKAEALTAFFG